MIPRTSQPELNCPSPTHESPFLPLHPSVSPGKTAVSTAAAFARPWLSRRWKVHREMPDTLKPYTSWKGFRVCAVNCSGKGFRTGCTRVGYYNVRGTRSNFASGDHSQTFFPRENVNIMYGTMLKWLRTLLARSKIPP